MEYSEELLDHYVNPRNVGSLDESDTDVGVCVFGNPDCGLVMRLHIKVDQNETIQAAKFKAYGCGCTIACASLMTEMLVGISLKEAKQISSDVIFDKLKLPFGKTHCSILAEDVLKGAIENYFEKQKNRPGWNTGLS